MLASVSMQIVGGIWDNLHGLVWDKDRHMCFLMRLLENTLTLKIYLRFTQDCITWVILHIV